MKIGRKFNELNKNQYFHYIKNHKKYTDFNTLGLYRSILENEKLTLEEKKEVRDFSNRFFFKTFEFLQIKDCMTYIKLVKLGEELTVGQMQQMYKDVEKYQQRFLADKRIKHRNFGVYSKHSCGIEGCHLNGLMIRQGSPIVECEMYFNSDKDQWSRKRKSAQRKKDRKNQHRIIREALEE